MQQITIETSTKSYPVYIGHGAIKVLGDVLKNSNYTSVMVITDENVADHHLSFLREQSGLDHFVEKIVPGGEQAKTFDVYYDCLSTALESRLDRKSLIVSFGGGAVGDLAGFVAATYMRGICFIQVPTTILAHDSAVGGKVAINHPLGKNMIGAFHQPEAVIYDLDFVKTLSEKELRSGFAEVIKHSLIYDPGFYDWLKKGVRSLVNIDEQKMLEFLSTGIKIKGSIVAKDERETGIRAYLNFGHTLGHAIEAEMGYGRMTHGEAVAIGMLYALQLSQDLVGLDFDLVEFKEWLGILGYKTSLPAGLSLERLVSKMQQDKKALGGTVRFVLLERVGKPTLIEVEEHHLTESLKKFVVEGEQND
jgi:3-dehydroquinate synthase